MRYIITALVLSAFITGCGSQATRQDAERFAERYVDGLRTGVVHPVSSDCAEGPTDRTFVCTVRLNRGEIISLDLRASKDGKAFVVTKRSSSVFGDAV